MKIRLTILIVLLCVGAFALFAQDEQTSFLDELSVHMERMGWSSDEVDAFSQGAAALSWPDVSEADPEVVALGLAYYRQRAAAESSFEDAAILARELATITSVMRQTGFSPVEIGRAAVTGTRDALFRGAVGTSTNGEKGVPGGETLGSLVREQVTTRIQEQARETASGRGPEVAREVIRRLGSPNDPTGGGRDLSGPPLVGSPFGPAN